MSNFKIPIEVAPNDDTRRAIIKCYDEAQNQLESASPIVNRTTRGKIIYVAETEDENSSSDETVDGRETVENNEATERTEESRADDEEEVGTDATRRELEMTEANVERVENKDTVAAREDDYERELSVVNNDSSLLMNLRDF
ncbi:unnamed protein product [Oikopleura dioica]|uniref:Uncharacterized protein n=1 Tax=Oikopleura dioica TaxID=34765 RepID=E4XUX9_OIKDI|nr:unnamed protein product [Oikopleura dioica]